MATGHFADLISPLPSGVPGCAFRGQSAESRAEEYDADQKRLVSSVYRQGPFIIYSCHAIPGGLWVLDLDQPLVDLAVNGR